jgi:hypothetical protein
MTLEWLSELEEERPEHPHQRHLRNVLEIEAMLRTPYVRDWKRNLRQEWGID